MTKEFAVPPVVFPSGGNPSVVNIQKRRVPTAPFQPTRATNPSIPFMSFDIGSVATASTSSSTLYGRTIGGNSSFEAEEPLLDELGIHPDQIRKKTLSILNPVRVNAHPHTDSDLSGPVLYYVAFSLFQLLAGKIQFGVILGWIVICSMFLYVVFNMLAGRTGNLDLHRCASIVGYCILPVTVFSAVSLCLPAGGVVSFVMAGLFVLWSTRVCTSLLVQSCPDCEEHGGLIAYFWFSSRLNEFGFQEPWRIKKVTEHGASNEVLADILEYDYEDNEDDDDDDLFEINLEAVNTMPPPHYYWESCFTRTGNTLLANCLLPIADVSNAVPIVVPKKACNGSTFSSLTSGLCNFFMIVSSAPGKVMGFTSFGSEKTI